ncbi:MAG: alpha/beta hydrolase [Candidatus Omnitrophota bacterium]
MRHLKGILQCERFQVPYRVCGEGQDVLCLNGAQQSMAMWLSFLQRFRDKYRITLFDFPHQGKGKVLEGSTSVSLDEEVEILRALVSELGIKRPIICSASWGGVVALQFAARFPQHVSRLILASIAMKPNGRMKETIMTGMQAKLDDREHMAQVLLKSFGGDLPGVCKNQIIAQFKSMPPDRIQAFAEHGMSVIFSGSLDKVVALSDVRNPTLILYGDKDRILDLSDVESLVAALPECRLRTVKGIGHFLHLENESVFDIYEEVLEKARSEIADMTHEPFNVTY